MIVRRKSVNDKYIVGTYLWAMEQLKNGKRMHRRHWALDRVIVFGEKPVYRPTKFDRSHHDWEIVSDEVILPPDVPTMVIVPEVVEEVEDTSSVWISYLVVIMMVCAVVAIALYVNSHHVRLY